MSPRRTSIPKVGTGTLWKEPCAAPPTQLHWSYFFCFLTHSNPETLLQGFIVFWLLFAQTVSFSGYWGALLGGVTAVQRPLSNSL